MSSLTLEQPLKLLGSNYRVCLRCHKLFKRKPGISNRRWDAAHKMCSVGCIAANNDRKNSERLPWGQNIYQCNVCGTGIVGKKTDLQKHKHEAHAY